MTEFRIIDRITSRPFRQGMQAASCVIRWVLVALGIVLLWGLGLGAGLFWAGFATYY